MPSRIQPWRRHLAAAAILCLPAVLAAQRDPAPPKAPALHPVELRDDLTYSDTSRDPRRNRLDLYLPRDVARPPLLMFVHGGTWMAGSKERHEFVGRTFAAHGVATAVINYRLSPFVQHPGHVQDCAAAFAWLYRHSVELGIDRSRMFLMGHSAGAHLVALLALDPQWLRAEKVPHEAVCGVVTLSAPFDVRPDNPVFRGVFGEDPKVRAAASPATHLHADAPPFLVFWAEREIYGLGDTNAAAIARMEEIGLPHESHEVHGHGHVSYLFQIGREGDVLTEPVLDSLRTWSAGK